MTYVAGIVVSQYLQNVTRKLALGAELLYQYGPTVPGNQIAIYTLAGRYTGRDSPVVDTLLRSADSYIC